jgi:hypothetical protein
MKKFRLAQLRKCTKTKAKNRQFIAAQRIALPAGRISQTPEHYRAKLGKLRCESWGDSPVRCTLCWAVNYLIAITL